MNLRWSRRLAITGAALMALLVLIFYISTDKTSIRQLVNTAGLPAIWLGTRFFRGAPLTRMTDVLFNVYLVSCTAIEGFLIGLGVDLIRNRRGQSMRQAP
jgi:hypothetical protein